MPPPPRSSWMRIGDLARRVGASEHQLRAWERRYGLLKPRRSSGNYRLYSNADEARVRIMQRYLERGIPTAQAAELAVAVQLGVSSGAGDTLGDDEATRARRAMRDALDEFDETAAQRALEGLFAAFSATTVVREVLLPYLHELGERWAGGHVTVAQEHFASNFLHARLLALARGWDRGLGPRALLACAPNEQHTLPLICFGVALHQLGWRIVYLGADTPIPVLAQAAEQTAPELIVLAAAMGERFLGNVAELRELAARWPLALAGAGVDPALAEEVGARHLSDDPVSEARTIGV